MGLATVASRAQNGLDATPVAVEVHVAGGLPGMTIVGLPEAAVRESKDRVRAALVNAGFQMPASRITVNLAPADLPKEGGRFDLAIAVGILVASGQVAGDRLQDCELLGELSLSAELRPVRGALSSSVRAGARGATLIVPEDNAAEAALSSGTRVLRAAHLLEICAWLQQEGELPEASPACAGSAAVSPPDLAEVLGQHQARRALEIAAAGGHSLLMIGPPGSGKSMLADRLPGILPPFIRGDGDLMVDGGLLDNLPYRAMRTIKAGPNVLVSLERARAPEAHYNYARIPGRAGVLLGLLRPGLWREPPAPGIADTIMRSMLAGRTDHARDLWPQDWLLTPPLPDEMSFMNWKAAFGLTGPAEDYARMMLRDLTAHRPDLLEALRLGAESPSPP